VLCGWCEGAGDISSADVRDWLLEETPDLAELATVLKGRGVKGQHLLVSR